MRYSMKLQKKKCAPREMRSPVTFSGRHHSGFRVSPSPKVRSLYSTKSP